MIPLVIMSSTIGSIKESSFLSLPDNPCTFCVYIIPALGQVSLGLLSLLESSGRRVCPELIVPFFLVLIVVRMSGLAG